MIPFGLQCAKSVHFEMRSRLTFQVCRNSKSLPPEQVSIQE